MLQVRSAAGWAANPNPTPSLTLTLTRLWRLLAEHPLVSAFAENADTDYGEGAFLQTVLPRFGIGEEAMRQTFPSAKGLATGLGRFAFAPEAHLTEASRLNANRSRLQLLSEYVVSSE